MLFLKKSLSVLSVVTMVSFLAACGSDSTSANSGAEDEVSSSSEVILSSSQNQQSSSSNKDESSSSSVILSSSSEGFSSSAAKSSSSVVAESSSDVIPDPDPGSSSSSATSSSSNVIPDPDPGSSSSSATSSSSNVIPDTDPESSSSVAESSSSEVILSSSQNQQSSSSEKKAAWDYLNPNIDYGEFTDERDGQVYKTVKIGDQVWMAENLNYRYVGVAFDYDGYSLDSISLCYENKLDSCAKYGRLYTWAAAIDSVGLAKDGDNPQLCGSGVECDRLTTEALKSNPIQGICPNGWHLPSEAEGDVLLENVGGKNDAEKALKTSSGWNYDGDGSDVYGFSALPAGSCLVRYQRGDFLNVGYETMFWLANQDWKTYAYNLELNYKNDYASIFSIWKNNRFHSVRCIKD